ncbi:MAG: TolC family protein, partial [candidate division WOR-3 bacterium]
LLLPTPSATGSYMMTIYDDTETETYDGNLQISQPLFDLPLFTQIKALHYQYQIDKALFKNSFQEILFKVEVAYLNLIRAQEILKSSEITLKRTRENERLTLEKYRLGVASKLDKLQAEVSALQAEKGLSQARRSFFEAQSELKVYLQINEDILPVDSLKIEDDFLIPPLDSLFKILEATNLSRSHR